MGNKVYWKGLEELEQTPEFVESKNNEFPAEISVDEFLGDDRLKETNTGRRDFLKFLGFSLTAATLASCETPVIKSIPYVNKPEDITPGVATWYASSYYDGNDFASVLVKTREGRPIHIKGNSLSSLTKGGVNSRVNSSVLSLYDSTRRTGPWVKGQGEAAWSDVDGQIVNKLDSISAAGGTIAVLSNTIISPSTHSAIAHFAGKYASNGGEHMMGGHEAVSDSTVAQAHAAAGIEMADNTGGNGKFRHVQYDAISYSGITSANKKNFGKAVVPAYDFTKAKVIVSIGADFCANWLLSTQYVGDYGSRRKPDGEWMSRHYQFETIMSITGANADVRAAIKPSEAAQVAAALIDALGGSAGAKTDSFSDAMKQAVAAAKEDLLANKGNSLVVAGSNDVGVQMLVNKINSMLGNYGSTIDLDNHLNIKQGDDAAVEQLIADMNSGLIDALVVLGCNPAYNLANSAGFKKGLEVMNGKGALTVSTSLHLDETADLCGFVCPDNHYLESWNDLNPAVGKYAVVQPTISKLHDTRQAMESLLMWAGIHHEADEWIQSTWKHHVHPHFGGVDFLEFWNQSVHNGVAEMNGVASKGYSYNGSVSEAMAAVSTPSAGDYEVILYAKAGIGDGTQSGNPWLHELPDPISKVTWDNYLTMSPADIRKNGWSNAKPGLMGDPIYAIGEEYRAFVAEVELNGTKVKLPIFPQPGQKPGTIGIALGYGRSGGADNVGRAAYQYGRYGDPVVDEAGEHVSVGANAFPMAAVVNGTVSYSGGAKFALIEGEEYEMACTQTHHTLMGRTSIVRETTQAVYKKGDGDKDEYNPSHVLAVHEAGGSQSKPVKQVDLWDDHPVEKVGHRWGMSIDLTTCLGCGTCITACNSENNVPVVGKDEVRRVREMHWLRLDRYYSSDEDAAFMKVERAETEADMSTPYSYAEMEIPSDQPSVVFMPMMCQHCNHAPCETVCPVAATTHSNEGLNMMTYNRCIGTRYCANNCPFKVRRFNWFNYNAYKKFTNVNPAQDDMGRMVLNPDVVVRTRGVMEKCSLCVQQIQAGKLQAKKEGRAVKDGDVQSACSSACPTNAITFGDLNDSHTQVAENSKDSRAYLALEEVGIQPNIYYMTKVRNTNNAEA